MTQLKDLGRRIELVSMDRHYHDISVSLYEDDLDGVPTFQVHTYSRRDGAQSRINTLVQYMRTLGGMVVCGEANQKLRFPCGQAHQRAAKRIFLEACKLDPEAAAEALPMQVFDKKAELTIAATGAGDVSYRISADGESEMKDRRLAAVAGGLMKLAEMAVLDPVHHHIGFDCGHAHDPLVGLLMPRALNVRAAIKEIEAAASRGVLAAPGAL